MADPKSKPMDEVRHIRDQVRERVRRLVAQRAWARAARVTHCEIRAATESDLPAVEALLTANALPLAGVREHFGSFLVAIDGVRIVGAVGIELYGAAALLRSVVVDQRLRGTGLGGRLTEAAVAKASAAGARSISLLTTTAAPFFASRGFEKVDWGALPSELAGSAELTGACPKSATAMHRQL